MSSGLSAWRLLHPMLAAALHGAIGGAVAAGVVDYHAFLTWKSFRDVQSYSWGTAAFRWLQGGVSGAVVGLGWGALVQ